MAVPADQHVKEESHSSRQQWPELDKTADVPRELKKELDRLDQEFSVPKQKLKEIIHRFREELKEGLAKHGQNIAMHQTWVHNLPSGNERGTFLTLDLGGTNLRVCEITLHGHDKQGKEKTELKQEQYKLPQDLKTSDADHLWDFIAGKLDDFVKSRGLANHYTKDNPMPLGFTFSYPATQSRIDHAVLKTWTKGFDIAGVESHNVAQQLRDKLETRNLPIDLICVINDTVGALIASAYNDPETIIGAIFGTGCNAAYMAKLSSIGKMSDEDRRKAAARSDKMAINCEYGAFDNARAVLPLTAYDKLIDAASPRPGEQAFEKMSAGLYLGEIFRLIMLDLFERGLVFKDQPQSQTTSTTSTTTPLSTPYSICTSLLSTLENDTSPSLRASRNALTQTLHLHSSPADLIAARHIATLIATRSARLCACGIAAICLNEGITCGHVAADGSVAIKQPLFGGRWGDAVGEVLGWGGRGREADAEGEGGERICMMSAEDGSGIGCAVVAAMEVERREREKERDGIRERREGGCMGR